MNDKAGPEGVFATAQQAMARGDWEAFFACIDRRDLLRLAGMGFGSPAPGSDAFRSMCHEHGIPEDALDQVDGCGRAIVESAREMWPPAADAWSDPDIRKALLERSAHHQDLVKAHAAAVATCLAKVADLAAFAAASERLKRAQLGGGSVSSTLLVGECLGDVRVEGKTAHGVRRLPGGHEEPVTFNEKRGVWYMRLLPSTRSRPR